MFELKNLHLRLTAHCNKRCEHCFASINDDMPELPVSYWIGLIAAARKMGVKAVTLTGGEPLVYHGITDLLKELEDSVVPIKMETNGVLLERYADNLLRLPTLKQIALSPGLHYEETYMNNLLHRIVLFRSKGLPLIMQANVILGDIQKQLLWLEHFADAGIPIRLMVGHNGLGSSKSLPNTPFDKILEIGRCYAGHSMIKCELPGVLLGKTESKGCGWNRNRADILPDGHLTPCAAIAWNYKDFVLDYVDQDNLEYVWKNNEYLNMIRSLNRCDFGGKCADCDHFELCQSSCVATNLGFTNNLFAGYPLCTYAASLE